MVGDGDAANPLLSRPSVRTVEHMSEIAPSSSAPPGRRATVAGAPLALMGVLSVQLGAALAVRLFPLVGTVGAVSLRFLGASIALVALTRPWRVRWTRGDVLASALFGIVLLSMNLSLYLAISRLPLATGITLEYLGPLTVTLVTATSARQRSWALPTVAGILLIGGSLKFSDAVGVLFALVAAACWACYIILNQRLGRRGSGLAGLSVASIFGTLLVLPAGVTVAGAALWRPSTLLIGLAVGVLSSAVGYSLDFLALRRLSAAVFGVLTSLNPAGAALIGVLLLNQRLPPARLAGIALVVAASIGMTLTRSQRRPPKASPSASTDGAEAVLPRIVGP
ncbi:MAG: rhtA1 [Acidimicrobiaceae bacterium]|nr:rhtA1 [Acidimicrobiaceae bacterium]